MSVSSSVSISTQNSEDKKQSFPFWPTSDPDKVFSRLRRYTDSKGRNITVNLALLRYCSKSKLNLVLCNVLNECIVVPFRTAAALNDEFKYIENNAKGLDIPFVEVEINNNQWLLNLRHIVHIVHSDLSLVLTATNEDVYTLLFKSHKELAAKYLALVSVKQHH